MITRTDLFNHTKTLVRKFIVPTIIKSTIWAVADGVVFCFAGAMVYWFGLASLLNGTALVLRLLVALVIIGIYVVLGIIAGLVLGGASALHRKLPEAQDGIHAVLSPLTNRIIQRIPIGQTGIPLNTFSATVDKTIASVISEPSQRGKLFSVVNWIASRVFHRLLSIFRRILLLDFIRSVEASGQTNINVQTLEQFARERLIQLVIKELRLKLYGFSRVTAIATAGCLLVPVLVIAGSIIL